MPLPDAEPAEKSRLYDELKSRNALGGATGGNTANLMDALRLATFLDADNEDVLRRILLIGQASGTTSSSGPIPGTSVVGYYQATNSGTRYTIYQPGPGEVYLLGPLSYQVSGGSGTVNVEQWIFAPDNIDGTSRRILLGNSSTSGASYNTIYEGGPNTPTYIDEQASVRVEATGTFTSVQFYQYLIRVR